MRFTEIWAALRFINGFMSLVIRIIDSGFYMGNNLQKTELSQLETDFKNSFASDLYKKRKQS
jgi:hypothetical protein